MPDPAACAPRPPPPEHAEPAGPRHPLLIAAVVATAFLMEQLDSTIITTALPAMARALHTSAVDMNLAVSAYVLTLAVFIPLSGWFADRFGTRRVFLGALLLFTAGSMACGAAQSFGMLVATRVVQGLGGAMMTPVGRLILLRSFPRSQLVRAMTYITLPAIIGPLLGPLVGGYLSTYLSWRWIFFVNVPFGLFGMALAARQVSPLAAEPDAAFDLVGFATFAAAVAAVQWLVESLGLASPALLLGTGSLGCLLLLAFVRRSRGSRRPAVDLGLLRERAFAIATLAGGLCRMAMNAPLYLLPLLLQIGLGMSPVRAGSLVFLSALGSPVIRLGIGPALKRWGFRALLAGSACACAAVLASFSAIAPATPHWAIAALIVVYGAVRSTQYMSSNTLAYADVASDRLSRATSLGGLLQQLTVSLGVGGGAAILRLLAPHANPGLGPLRLSFLVLAALPLLAIPFFLRLHPSDGATVSGHVGAPAAR